MEDDRELRQVVCYSLMDIGASCVEATDGRQALEVLCRSIEPDERFDCVLLDILMPGGVSGWDVLEAIRANPLWSDIPVIILSGKATLLAEQERRPQARRHAYPEDGPLRRRGHRQGEATARAGRGLRLLLDLAQYGRPEGPQACQDAPVAGTIPLAC